MINLNFVKSLLFVGFLSIITACQQPAKNTGLLSEGTADWAMESNFKLDFGDKKGQIEELKGRNEELMKHILDAVESGTMTAYDYETEEKLNKKQVKAVFEQPDTIIMYDDNGYETGEKPIVNELNRPAVKKFRVKQEWFWDTETATLQSKVKGLAPMETIFNEDGETARGDLPLFWVFF